MSLRSNILLVAIGFAAGYVIANGRGGSRSVRCISDPTEAILGENYKKPGSPGNNIFRLMQDAGINTDNPAWIAGPL